MNHNDREFDAMIDTLHAIRRVRDFYGSGPDAARLTAELINMLKRTGEANTYTAVNSPAWHVAEGLAKVYKVHLVDDQPGQAVST